MHKRTHTGSSYSTHKWHLVKKQIISFCLPLCHVFNSPRCLGFPSALRRAKTAHLKSHPDENGWSELITPLGGKQKQTGWFECAPAIINPSPYVKPQIIDSHAPCRQEQRPQDYVAGMSHGWEQSLQEASMAGAPTPTITEVKWQWRLGGLLWQLVSCVCSTSMMTSHREHG